MLGRMSPRLLAALILALAALPSQAQTYKWVDAKGQTNYSNAPPPTVLAVAQMVEERISIMGMDPQVRAWAERKFAAEEADWQHRVAASNAQQRALASRPQSSTLSPSRYYSSGSYYPGSTYGYVSPVFFASVPATTSFRGERSHGHRGGHHRR